ncbi:arsenate reductase family protein [uncultured Phascolarctobacterium sp.]|uniref:arsenate reductase family protein n=1 Tax=uncultured Phascolarctobacterium sp. TaxID=512296 RepID=UPI0025F5A3FA|nr:arsenate reductase family protein [uncultured Phascolarctobacterium sp.]
MLFVCYPKCSTCKKAEQYLQAKGLSFTVRDIKTDNPTVDELRTWHEASGLPLKRFFNTSGILYKQLGLKDKLPTMSEDEQLQLLASDGMLVKRPLVIYDGGVLVGFKQAEYDEKL